MTIAGGTLTSSSVESRVEQLIHELSKDAVERDKQGGTAKRQRDLIRELDLLHLLVPKQYGGEGYKWSEILLIVRDIATVDPSIAHLFGYHYLQLVTPHLCSSKVQKEYFYRESVKNNWFWGNCFNPLDIRLKGRKEGDRIRLNGTKTFSTGSRDADKLLLSWIWEDSDQHEVKEKENSEYNPLQYDIGVAAIPITREGVNVHANWDGIGQRQTDSGTVTFQDVLVEKDEILDREYSGQSAFTTLDAVLSQIILTNVFIGTAQGALATAKSYTKKYTKPWIASSVDHASDDPYILRKYGELFVHLQGALTLTDVANQAVDEVWELDHSLTEEKRGEAVIKTATANALATEVSLSLTSEIFEVMGARSATTKHGFDRFWRNIRTHTLHNPIEYKRKNIGNWYLNNEFPKPTPYS